MSIVVRPETLPLRPLVDGDRLDQPTFHARYAAMPDDVRAELVDGVVYLMSPLRRNHADLDNSMGGWLFHFKRFTPGVACPANATTKLGPDSEVQPDGQLHIREACGGRVRVVDGYLVGPPEMIVEIGHSSRAYDLGPKKDQYERYRVMEYLFVGIEPDEVNWFVRRADRFETLTPAEDGTLRSETFPGLWLDPNALYAEDLDRLIATLDRGLATPEHAAFAARLNPGGIRR